MTRIFSRWDPQLLVLTLVATALGLFFIFDAGYPRAMAKGLLIPPDFRQQAIYAVAAVVLGGLASRISAQRWRRLSRPMWGLGFVALLAVEFFGTTQNGAKRWLDFKFIMLQPAEFVKVAAIVYLAAVFADRPKWPSKLPKFSSRAKWLDVVGTAKLRRLLPGIWVLVAVFLIEHEPDLGTAAVVFATALAMFVIGGASRQTLVIGLSLCVVFIGALVFKEPYRVERFQKHFHRWDTKVMDDIGYQTVQSEVAMASGGLAGVGIGGSRAKHVMPAATTDFVMATVAEETGLIGSLLVLGILAAICMRLLKLAHVAKTDFVRLVLTGTAVWIGVQSATNIVMSNGTAPAIGIPLPFISFGGSSLVALWLCLGLGQGALATERAKEAKEVETSPDGWRNRRPHLSGA